MSVFNQFLSALDVLQSVSAKYGIDRFTSYVGNQDVTPLQLLTALNDVGEELIEVQEWEFLRKEYAFNTVIGQTEYDLPEDFDRFQDVTMWNQTTSTPLVGSITAPTWKRLKASTGISGILYLLYQVKGNKLVLFNTPTAVETLTTEYISRGWVRDVEDEDNYKDRVTEDTDLILYPKKLIKTLVALRWCQVKGFDTTAIGAEAAALLSASSAKDVPAERLSILRRRSSRLLSVDNVPDTGYGS